MLEELLPVLLHRARLAADQVILPDQFHLARIAHAVFAPLSVVGQKPVQAFGVDLSDEHGDGLAALRHGHRREKLRGEAGGRVGSIVLHHRCAAVARIQRPLDNLREARAAEGIVIDVAEEVRFLRDGIKDVAGFGIYEIDVVKPERIPELLDAGMELLVDFGVGVAARRRHELVLFAEFVRIAGDIVGLEASRDGIGGQQGRRLDMRSRHFFQLRRELLAVPGRQRGVIRVRGDGISGAHFLQSGNEIAARLADRSRSRGGGRVAQLVLDEGLHPLPLLLALRGQFALDRRRQRPIAGAVADQPAKGQTRKAQRQQR